MQIVPFLLHSPGKVSHVVWSWLAVPCEKLGCGFQSRFPWLSGLRYMWGWSVACLSHLTLSLRPCLHLMFSEIITSYLHIHGYKMWGLILSLCIPNFLFCFFGFRWLEGLHAAWTDKINIDFLYVLALSPSFSIFLRCQLVLLHAESLFLFTPMLFGLFQEELQDCLVRAVRVNSPYSNEIDMTCFHTWLWEKISIFVFQWKRFIKYHPISMRDRWCFCDYVVLNCRWRD